MTLGFTGSSFPTVPNCFNRSETPLKRPSLSFWGFEFVASGPRFYRKVKRFAFRESDDTCLELQALSTFISSSAFKALPFPPRFPFFSPLRKSKEEGKGRGPEKDL